MIGRNTLILDVTLLEIVQRGAVQLQYVPTSNQVEDILTKSLGRAKFVEFREQMGMVENLFQ